MSPESVSGSRRLAGVSEAFRIQATWCEALGSDLYARLLGACAEDVERGGPVAETVAEWNGDPLIDALPLRLVGCVHAEVLGGRAPALARFYPSAGGTPAWPEVWEAFRRFVSDQRTELSRRLAEPVQTNETSRCAALLPGFAAAYAAGGGLPLRLLEPGASAGLNLLWDRYRYELGSAVRGDPDAPVVIRCQWTGPLPAAATPPVVERRGCDLAPVDLGDPDAVQRLEGFVWPDQIDRLARLRAAVRLARQWQIRVEPARAGVWIGRHLRVLPEGTHTVLFHSIFWHYLDTPEQEAIRAHIEAAAQRATSSRPLSWLRMELGGTRGAEVRLTTWPPGEERLLAYASPHPGWVEIVAGARVAS